MQLNIKKKKGKNNPIKKRVEDLNKHFSKEKIEMVIDHMERWSTALTVVIVYLLSHA